MNKIIKKLKQELSYLTGQFLLWPQYINLAITYKCNFHCKSCSIWQKKNYPELTNDQWFKIGDGLIKNLPKDSVIEISGGEPLLRKNLTLALIKKLKTYFKTISLNSNGSLINPSIVKMLKKSNLDIIKISLYSLDKKIHNNLRGTNIASGKAKKAIELLSKSGIKIHIGILITSKNISFIPDLINYYWRKKNINLILQPLDEIIESKQSKLRKNVIIKSLWPNKNQIKMFFLWLDNNKKKVKNSKSQIIAIKKYYFNPPSILRYRCFAGQKVLVVYPNGDVAFCIKRPTIGNLKSQDLHKILKNAKIERLNIKKCSKYCRIVGCVYLRGLKEFIISKIKIK